MRRILQTFFLSAFLVAGLPLVAVAQENTDAQNTEETSEPAKPTIKHLPPAYGPKMLRLAEILGGLHYLRELCGADEGQLWRQQMSDILIAEEPIPQRRAELIAHFNRGFRGYQESYRECTSSALEANKRYVREGARLAADIPNRYGR